MVLVEHVVIAVTNLESCIFLCIVKVIKAVLRNIRQSRRRLQVRTSCVADSLRVVIQVGRSYRQQVVFSR
jgi:hypothetical protein